MRFSKKSHTHTQLLNDRNHTWSWNIHLQRCVKMVNFLWLSPITLHCCCFCYSGTNRQHVTLNTSSIFPAISLSNRNSQQCAWIRGLLLSRTLNFFFNFSSWLPPDPHEKTHKRSFIESDLSKWNTKSVWKVVKWKKVYAFLRSRLLLIFIVIRIFVKWDSDESGSLIFNYEGSTWKTVSSLFLQKAHSPPNDNCFRLLVLSFFPSEIFTEKLSENKNKLITQQFLLKEDSIVVNVQG